MTGSHDTAALPPFGATAHCTKCTCPDIQDAYRATAPQLRWNTAGDLVEITTFGGGPDCILRTCRDCGWAWLEQCADAEPPARELAQ